MKDNDELCLCFHVTMRKVKNYIRIERPKRISQLSECYGAGTGCGWCRPFLARLFEQHQQSLEGVNLKNTDDIDSAPETDADLPSSDDYASARCKYVREGGGQVPPGGTPIG